MVLTGPDRAYCGHCAAHWSEGHVCDSLDEAMWEAQKSLPLGWSIRSLTRTLKDWEAVAAEIGHGAIKVGRGDSPAAALRDIAR